MTETLQGILTVTGGTGTFGQVFIPALLAQHRDLVIRVISRDEYKQAHMQAQLRVYADRLRFFLGDVRDAARLRLALRDSDYLVHAAALKRIEQSEYNPYEFVHTNVIGTMHVAQAAIDAGVKVAVFLSTDKAVEPANVYGSTKNLAEKVWIQSNTYAPTGTLFCATRYGNILGSRGSVVEIWRRCLTEQNPLPVTDLEATRFAMSITQAVSLVRYVLRCPARGGIFVPLLRAFRLDDLLQSLLRATAWPAYTCLHKPLHAGEKAHETLLTAQEQARTVCVTENIWCIPPAVAFWEGDTTLQALPGLPLRHPELATAPYCSATWPYRIVRLEGYL